VLKSLTDLKLVDLIDVECSLVAKDSFGFVDLVELYSIVV